MNLDKYLDDLQEIYIFNKISKDELKHILVKYNANIKNYSKNTMVSSDYNCLKSLNIILKGAFAREFVDNNNNVVTVNKLKKGDSFGGLDLFHNGNIESSFTLFALEDTIVLEINRDDLLDLFQYNRVILVNFLETISFKVMEFQTKLEIMSYKSVRERIIYYLKKCYLRCNSTTIVLVKNKKQIAEFLGVQRTSLSRELNKMKEENIISYDRFSIEILDLKSIIS